MHRRCLHSLSCKSRAGQARRFNGSLASAYADKIKAKLSVENVSTIEELKAKLTPERKPAENEVAPSPSRPSETGTASAYRPTQERERRDSSPVKPLESFFNVSAIMSKPHTVQQITALWTLYHASRSSGTGRGYVSAVVPLQSYERMLERARLYPMFVLPLLRSSDDAGPPSLSGPSVIEQPAEFHYLQWGLHSSPPIPQPVPKNDPFPFPPSPAPSVTAHSGKSNPPTSTILFTPLVQYKLHQSYAPPYFVITHHTDLAQTHGIVLLRGEITPSTSVAVRSDEGASDGKYLLSQVDAQMLALGVQQFYLHQEGEGTAASVSREAEDLLHKFHKKPEEFRWESLLKFKGGLASWQTS